MPFRDPFYLKFLDEANLITSTDESGYIVDANEGFLRVSGYSKNELIGKKHTIMSAGIQDEHFYRTLWNTIKTGQPWTGDICDLSKDGRKLWFRTSIRPKINEQGEVVRFYAMHTLINDIKEAEELRLKLLEKTSMLAQLLDHVSDAVIATDLNFNIAYWNKGCENLYGFKAEEAMGRPISEMVPTEFGEGSSEEESAETLMKSGFWSGEVKQRDRYGKLHHISAVVSIIKDDNGQSNGVLAVNRDISERVQAIQALKESEERLKSFMRHCPAPAWILDERGAVRACSPSCILFCGDVPNPFQDERPIWEFLPDHKAQHWRKQFEKLLKSGGSDQELMIFRNGTELESAWLMHQFVLNETSSPRLIGGVAIDISARIREEEHLKNREEYLKNLIEKHQDLTLVLNEEGLISLCTPASREVLGAEPDHLVGIYFGLGLPPEYLSEWQTRFEKLKLKPGNIDQFEIRYLHRNGNWVYLDVSASNCKDIPTLGGIVLYLRNVSSQKAVEQQLTRQNNQLLEIAWLQSDPIRKPITAILSLTESVSDRLPEGSKERDSLRVVRDEALQLEKLVTEITRKANMLIG